MPQKPQATQNQLTRNLGTGQDIGIDKEINKMKTEKKKGKRVKVQTFSRYPD